MGTPAPGDKILIVRPCWLQLILSGEKMMDIRGSALRPGKYFLGFQKQILAQAQLGKPVRILSAQWIALRPQRRVMLNSPPHKRTHGLPILPVHAINEPRPISAPPRGNINC